MRKLDTEAKRIVLMADDDQEDFILVSEAFEENGLNVELHWVEDGEEAMDYLAHRGKYASPESSPRPDLILLDVTMPRKDGLETLKELKGHPELRKIPVVMLTASRKKEHMSSSYRFGADMFLIKPCSFAEMIQAMGSLCAYWFNIVRLPEKAGQLSPDMSDRKSA